MNSNHKTHCLFLYYKDNEFVCVFSSRSGSAPVDLGMLQKQLLSGHYVSLDSFHSDMLKVFLCAEVSFTEDSWTHLMFDVVLHLSWAFELSGSYLRLTIKQYWMNEWCTCIALYCVLLYTQKNGQNIPKYSQKNGTDFFIAAHAEYFPVILP